MAKYNVLVKIIPRAGLLDPAGQAVEKSLHSLGYTQAKAVNIGRLVSLQLDAENTRVASELVIKMCDEMLVNPITEDYEFEVNPA